MRLCFDIETDGLDHSKIWLIAATDIISGQSFVFTDYEDQYPDLKEFTSVFDKADSFVGHNIVQFDFPAIMKHLDWSPRDDQQILDTMIISQLNDQPRPSLDRFKALSKAGNHAMATFGYALGDEKHDDPGWMEYSVAMRERCISDVVINIKIFRYLMKEIQLISTESPNYGQALKLEHSISQAMSDQRLNGWLFNDTSARDIIRTINIRMATIEMDVEPHLKPRRVFLDKEPRVAKRLLNGQYDRVTREWFGDREVESPYQRVKLIDTDLGNNAAVLELLLANGWIPTEYNGKKVDGKFVKSSPKLTEDSYDSITGDLGKQVAEWRTLRSRRGLLEGLLRLQRPDGRISCDAFVIGTNTFRMRHKGIVNIPGSYAHLGSDIRKCFTSAPGRSIVACDSDSNQLRGLAHYLNNQEVSDAIASGSSEDGTDIHTRNANLVGVSRPVIKTLTYALLFSAGDKKLGDAAGMKGKGKDLRAKMMVAYSGYEAMLDRIQGQWDDNAMATGRGYLVGLDGRRIYCERFKSFNALLQGFEAVVCKAAVAEAVRTIKAEGLDANVVAMVHDEVNLDVSNADTGRVSEILEHCFGSYVTETYNLNLPMGGTADVGNDWNAVH